MKDHAVKTPARRDPVASLTLGLVAVGALAVAWFLPWWSMEARAPQYGQRVLIVEISPKQVKGDIFEMDTLGHYVGIRPIATIALFERSLAPYGIGLAALGIALTPFLRRRLLRLAAVLPTLLMPFLFVLDLDYWMDRSTRERDMEAALNLTVTDIQTRIFGNYELAQFKITAKAETGLFLAGLAAVLSLGLAFSGSLRRACQARTAPAALAALLVAALLPGSAGATELLARPGDLDGALARAVAGDTVRVLPGVHRGSFRIATRLRLVGEPGAVLDGGGQGTVLSIAEGADGAEVVSVTIRGSGESYTTEDAAIRIEKVKGVRIADTRVEETLFGLFLLEADRTVIERCTVLGKDLPIERRADGIRLWYSSDCRLIGNTVERSRDVIIWYSSGTVAEDNVVRNSRYGLHYMYSDRNVFRRNHFDDNQVGAAIMYSRGIELAGNTFCYANGPSAYGLLVKDADDVFVRDNRFVGNATGLFFDNAPQSRDGKVEVRRNLVARNDVGLQLQPLAHGIRLWENAFVGNVEQVAVQGSGTAEANEWAVAGRGNYWSDALVYDRDRDGVSEIPFRMEQGFEALSDRKPELAFFQGTPAMEAIDTASRLFPIFAPRPKLTDPHPLAALPLSDTARGPAGARLPLALAGLSLSTFSAILAALARAVLA